MNDIIEKIKGCGGCARRREWIKKQKEKAEARIRAIKEKAAAAKEQAKLQEETDVHTRSSNDS